MLFPIMTTIVRPPCGTQWDNKNDPAGTCFSESCLMLMRWAAGKQVCTDEDYIKTVTRLGGTTIAASQVRALAHYGFKAQFRSDMSREDVNAHLRTGEPICLGYLHRGPVNAPFGFGHWCIAWDRLPNERGLKVHDPGGDPDLINGGFLSRSGCDLSFSWRNFGPRFLPYGASSGYGLFLVS